MEKTKRYILNPDYNYKNDIKRALIIANADNQSELSINEWVSIIHPVQAMILSFFSFPISIDEALQKLSEFLDLPVTEVEKIITPFIENEDTIYTEYDGSTFSFPKKIIIEFNDALKINYTYKPEDFIYQELDFESYRYFHSPSAITLMVTNQCVTNCIYCYADRRQNISCQIPFERIKEIIKEAKELKLKNIYVGGGEFFMYDKWYELLCEFRKYGYDNTFISTKVPINESNIIKLKEFPRLAYQFSFDSTSEQKTSEILDVSLGYSQKMKKTLRLMDKHGLHYQVISVITKLNSDEEGLTNMYNFLSSLENIIQWQVRPAFRSLYSSTTFESIKLNIEEREQLYAVVDKLNSLNKLKVGNDKSFIEKGYFTAENGSHSFPGSSCSANRSHLYILPDGNITICEQMYWNPRFIVGNILKNSIYEVWNSPAALKWVNMTKDDFRDESVCKNCEMLQECTNKRPNKCWADVLKAYGDENWDFPDPRCKKAPAFLNSIS